MVLQRAGEVSLLRLRGSVEMVLCAVIRIVRDNIEGLGDFELVHVRLHHAAVVVCHKLVRAPRCAH